MRTQNCFVTIAGVVLLGMLCFQGVGHCAGELKGVSIIFDTDMGNDIDDALALAICNGLANAGECRLLAITVSKDNPYAAEYTSILQSFYGRPEIPIGLVENGVTPEAGNYIQAIAEEKDADGRLVYPRTVTGDKPAVGAVALLRKVLAAQPEQSVVLVVTGFSTNAAGLLRSGPDDYSPLSGMELAEAKLRRVCMMAGNFSEAALANPEKADAEYNIVEDVSSAKYFIDHCPVPILFSGFEIGNAILYPADSIEKDFAATPNHPLAEAYKRYMKMKMPYDRPCWDLTAVLEAVRPENDYFRHSSKGTVTVRADGRVGFRADAQGRHQYLILNEERKDAVKRLFVELVLRAEVQYKNP
jgi:inosine-uridine nucleoside N-ribohydrolase